MLRDFEPGEIGCVIVSIPVHESYKAVVVHGFHEGVSEYGTTRHDVVEKLKNKILSGSRFKHHTWMVLEPEDLSK